MACSSDALRCTLADALADVFASPLIDIVFGFARPAVFFSKIKAQIPGNLLLSEDCRTIHKRSDRPDYAVALSELKLNGGTHYFTVHLPEGPHPNTMIGVCRDGVNVRAGLYGQDGVCVKNSNGYLFVCKHICQECMPRHKVGDTVGVLVHFRGNEDNKEPETEQEWTLQNTQPNADAGVGEWVDVHFYVNNVRAGSFPRIFRADHDGVYACVCLDRPHDVATICEGDIESIELPPYIARRH